MSAHLINRDGHWFYRVGGEEKPIRDIHARLCRAKGIEPKPSWINMTAEDMRIEGITVKARKRRCWNTLPPPDPAKVARARKRAEERGLSWLAHGSVGLLMWWMRMGRAQKETISLRLAVCQGCEHFGAGVSCGKCGCNFRAKLSGKNEVCPLGKW